ncbi:unnamed protein product [Nesidiocoris tenuis]|uniref:Uncharacterized protein n=1 Tax=Nesidiocoris tenuis TaxID=355587 RepID=A0A6H5GBJ8_9HEMI|nr:unnamed protein product [Nesidiocoris tenuis]
MVGNWPGDLIRGHREGEIIAMPRDARVIDKVDLRLHTYKGHPPEVFLEVAIRYPTIAGIPYGSVSGRVAEYFATMKPSLGRVRTDSYGDVLPPSDLRADHTIGLQSI